MDDEFASLCFNTKRKWWRGKVNVGPQVVELTVHATKQGPSGQQRVVWKLYRSELARMALKIIADYVASVEQPPSAPAVQAQDFELTEIIVSPDKWCEKVDMVFTYKLRGDDYAIWRMELLRGKLVSATRDN